MLAVYNMHVKFVWLRRPDNYRTTVDSMVVVTSLMFCKKPGWIQAALPVYSIEETDFNQYQFRVDQLSNIYSSTGDQILPVKIRQKSNRWPL